jgi:hypothetical protein
MNKTHIPAMIHPATVMGSIVRSPSRVEGTLPSSSARRGPVAMPIALAHTNAVHPRAPISQPRHGPGG